MIIFVDSSDVIISRDMDALCKMIMYPQINYHHAIESSVHNKIGVQKRNCVWEKCSKNSVGRNCKTHRYWMQVQILNIFSCVVVINTYIVIIDIRLIFQINRAGEWWYISAPATIAHFVFSIVTSGTTLSVHYHNLSKTLRSRWQNLMSTIFEFIERFRRSFARVCQNKNSWLGFKFTRFLI